MPEVGVQTETTNHVAKVDENFFDGFQHKPKDNFFTKTANSFKTSIRKNETAKTHNDKSASKREEHEAARDRAKGSIAEAYLLSEKVVRYTKPTEGNEVEKQELIEMTTSPALFQVVKVSRKCAEESPNEKEVGKVIDEAKEKAKEVFIFAEGSASSREVLMSLEGKEEKEREEGLNHFQTYLEENEEKLKDKLNRSDAVLGEQKVKEAVEEKPSATEGISLDELMDQDAIQQIIEQDQAIKEIVEDDKNQNFNLNKEGESTSTGFTESQISNIQSMVEQQKTENEIGKERSNKEKDFTTKIKLFNGQLDQISDGRGIDINMDNPDVGSDITLKSLSNIVKNVNNENSGKTESEQFNDLMMVAQEIKPQMVKVVKDEEEKKKYKSANFEKNMIISVFTRWVNRLSRYYSRNGDRLKSEAEDKGETSLKAYGRKATGVSHFATTVGVGLNAFGAYNSYNAMLKALSNKDGSTSSKVMSSLGFAQSSGTFVNSCLGVVNIGLQSGTLKTASKNVGGILALAGGLIDIANGSLAIHGARKTAASIKKEMGVVDDLLNNKNDSTEKGTDKNDTPREENYKDLKNILGQARKNTIAERWEGSVKIVTGAVKTANLDPTVGAFVGTAASLVATLAEFGVNFYRKHNIRGFAEQLVPWKRVRDDIKKGENKNEPIGRLSDRDYRQKTLFYAGSATGELEESGLRGIQSIITALSSTNEGEEGYQGKTILKNALGVSDKASTTELGLKLGLTKTMAANLKGAIALRVERHEKSKKRGALGFMKNRHLSNVGQFFRRCGAG